MYRQAERLARGLALSLAVAGGAALLAMIAVSCVSILGRAGQNLGLPLTSVRGDTEWIEFGMGLAVFAFLPWCTIERAHARVDILSPLFRAKGNQILDAVSDLLMLGLAGLVGWRMWLGLLDKRGWQETTFILRTEVWLGYAAAMAGAAAFVLVAAFCLWRSLRALAGR